MKRSSLGVVLDDLDTLFEAGTATGLSDSHLLERYLSRPDGTGEAAFAAIVQRHGPMVHRVCRGVLGEWHDADDAFQATFLILARKASSIRAGGSIASWLYGVARRVAIHARNERNRRTERERSAGTRIEEHRADREPAELMPEIQEELDRLPEKYRSTIVLCDLEGLTHEEAASALRVPVGTVKVRLFRGRERLRGRFVRRGLALECLAVGGPAFNLSRTASPLVESTIQAAMRITAGQAAGTSAPVAALVQGALRAMIFTRLKAVLLMLAVSVPVLLTASLSRSEGPKDRAPQEVGDRKAPRSVEAGPGEKEQFTETLKRTEFVGTLSQWSALEPISRLNVFSSIPGRLKSISVDVGDPVKAGEVLAEIEAPLLLVDVEEAKALVEREQARVEQAAIHLNNAKAGLLPGTTRGRFDTDAIIRATTEEAKAELAIARSELKVAMTRLQRAHARVGMTRVVSPIDGVVIRRMLQPGEIARGLDQPATAILEIADTSRLKARVDVPERELAFLEKGHLATLSRITGIDDDFKGKVARIEVMEQSGNSTVGVVVLFDNPKSQLRPGQRVKVNLELTKQPGVLTIPGSAIISRTGGEFEQEGACYRVVNGRANRTPIRLGTLDDQKRRFQVLSGLNEGDQIITIITPDIRDGQPIGSPGR